MNLILELGINTKTRQPGETMGEKIKGWIMKQERQKHRDRTTNVFTETEHRETRQRQVQVSHLITVMYDNVTMAHHYWQ